MLTFLLADICKFCENWKKEISCKESRLTNVGGYLDWCTDKTSQYENQVGLVSII